MKNEFIPYEEALALKELGFNDHCLGYFSCSPFMGTQDNPTFKYWDQNVSHKCENTCEFFTEKDCTRPLYQQIFRWFREKQGLFSTINCTNTKIIKDSFEIRISRLNENEYSHYGYKTYEEAELACLINLIKILKNKYE